MPLSERCSCGAQFDLAQHIPFVDALAAVEIWREQHRHDGGTPQSAKGQQGQVDARSQIGFDLDSIESAAYGDEDEDDED